MHCALLTQSNQTDTVLDLIHVSIKLSQGTIDHDYSLNREYNSPPMICKANLPVREINHECHETSKPTRNE
jgi:hypothetical protein